MPHNIGRAPFSLKEPNQGYIESKDKQIFCCRNSLEYIPPEYLIQIANIHQLLLKARKIKNIQISNTLCWTKTLILSRNYFLLYWTHEVPYKYMLSQSTSISKLEADLVIDVIYLLNRYHKKKWTPSGTSLIRN